MKTFHVPCVKNISVEIKKIGLFYRISLRGVTLAKSFFTYSQAESHLSELHNYFGDNCIFVVKKVA